MDWNLTEGVGAFPAAAFFSGNRKGDAVVKWTTARPGTEQRHNRSRGYLCSLTRAAPGSAAASSEGVIAWAASRWTVHIANAGDRGLAKDGKMTDKDVAWVIKQYRIDVEKMKRDGA